MDRLRTRGLLACFAAALTLSGTAGRVASTAARAPEVRAPARATAAPGVAARSGARPRGGPASPVASAVAPIDHVVLITVDSLRADVTREGGYTRREIAPVLTALTARAVRYRRAYSLSSYTAMSLASMLASRLPGELRRGAVFFTFFHDANVFFPEVLRAAGVRTVAAHAHFYFRPNTANFEQGFDAYEVVPNVHTNFYEDPSVTAEQHVPLAERMISAAASLPGRSFAWLHMMDPHGSYQPHPDVAEYGRSQRDQYDAEVTYTDRWLGRLVDFIERQPWGARTAIIISADHGQGFGEHGRVGHGGDLWENLVHVPLLFLVPGAEPRAIDTPRSHLDLAPTIAEMLGVAPSPEFRGRSLLAEIRGAPAEVRDVWLDLPRTLVSRRRRALIHDRHKLIAFDRDRRYDVFDVAADPGELTPLNATDRATYDAMVERYTAGQRAFRDFTPSDLPPE